MNFNREMNYNKNDINNIDWEEDYLFEACGGYCSDSISWATWLGLLASVAVILFLTIIFAIYSFIFLEEQCSQQKRNKENT